jgi:hypothetical protein
VPSRQAAADPSLKDNLTRHVAALAFERNTRRPEQLDRAADYIEKFLQSLGYQIESQWYETAGIRVRNLEVVLKRGDTNAPIVVVGAPVPANRAVSRPRQFHRLCGKFGVAAVDASSRGFIPGACGRSV